MPVKPTARLPIAPEGDTGRRLPSLSSTDRVDRLGRVAPATSSNNAILTARDLAEAARNFARPSHAIRMSDQYSKRNRI
jgi:predicted ATPase